MCAIIGWSGRAKRGQWKLVHRLLTELFIASAARGTDASGFAAIDRQGNVVMDKQPLPSAAFTATSSVWRRLSHASCLIAHCRAATHGRPDTGDNRNNHPFVSDDASLGVVVNGVSPNYRDVADAYSVSLTSECDSEVVLRVVEAAQHPAEGLDDCLRHLDGGLAAALVDSRRRSVWLGRNEGRPIWVFRLIGVRGAFACSTRAIAEDALFRTLGRSAHHLIELLAPVSAGTVLQMSTAGTLIAVRRANGFGTRIRQLRRM